MKIKQITLVDAKAGEEFDVDKYITDSEVDEYEITIPLVLDMKFEDLVREKRLLKLIKEKFKQIKNIWDDWEEKLAILKEASEMDLNIIDNCPQISIPFFNGLGDYLKKNPFLQDKDLILQEEYDVNHQHLDKILNELADYKNIKVQLNGNINPVTIDEYEKTVLAIDDMTSKIKKYNLSPLEQIMYAYDLTRERIYNEESSEESFTVSRDLSSVLFSDKIVCVGYAVIFEKILSNLGIKNMMCSFRWDDVEIGHRRNIVYVKDDKYNIDGVYYFDPTWDSKKDVDNMDYLNSYRYFGIPKEEIDKNKNMFGRDVTLLNYFQNANEIFECIVNHDNFDSLRQAKMNLFNKISNFIDGKQLFSLFETLPKSEMYSSSISDSRLKEIKKDLERYKELFFGSEITTLTKLKAFYNVRKVEYYEEPQKYSFDVATFENVTFDYKEETFEEKLMRRIFEGESDYDKFADYFKEMELEKDINRVKSLQKH